MWMPASATVPPAARVRSARGTSSPAGAKMTMPSARGGIRSAGPPTHPPPRARRGRRPGGGGLRRAELSGGAAGPRDRQRDVRRRAEAVEAKRPARRDSRELERAVADDAGAQERRRLGVAEDRGQRIDVRL